MKLKEKIKAKSTLCLLRNEAIIYRYHYWNNIRHLKRKQVLEQLNIEFFMSSCSVQEIIYDNHKFYKELKSKKPKLDFLKGKYSFFVWENQKN